MTNEEPVPSTSSVLSAAEKNVKICNGSKKRKGLDIDALWRKKLKDVENGKSPEKGSSSQEEAGASPEKVEKVGKMEKVEKSKEPVVTGKQVPGPVAPSKTVKPVDPVKAVPVKAIEAERPKKPEMKPHSTPVKKEKVEEPEAEEPVTTRSTRSLRKRPEKKTEEEAKKKNMEEQEDVKPNIKLLKKATPSFQCSTLANGVVGDVRRRSARNAEMLDPNKISLHHANYGEESQDEMESMHESIDGQDSRDGAQYEFATMEYQSAVTPTYTLYAADSTSYAPYYPELQYPSNNLQSSPQEGSYLVQGTPQPGGPQSPQSIDDNDVVGIGQNTRASPATINWLLSNYETAEGTSLPRCQLYDHYRKHCSEHRLDPVNAASFGKLIRSVFLGLKTRRLGTRGNSKYHYYGIRIKPDSNLQNDMPNEVHGVHISNYSVTPPMSHRDSYAETVNSVAASKYVEVEMPLKRTRKEHSSSSSSCRDSSSPNIDLPNQSTLNQTTKSVIGVIPDPPIPAHSSNHGVYKFTEIDKSNMGKTNMPLVEFQNKTAFVETQGFRKLCLGKEVLDSLILSYHKMCQDVLQLVKQVDFATVEDVWIRFWSGCSLIDHDVLMALCSDEKIQEWIIEVDLALYQTIVDCLIPNVLLSELSVGMTQSCRTFAKNIDIYLRKALMTAKLDESFVKKKIQAIKYMQQGLKRYTSLNHLAHAARGVLMKEEQVAQMYQDYMRVDINTVHQQAGWICGCDSMMVNHVNSAFKANLQSMSPMEEWAEWLESIVDQVLAKYHDKPASTVSNVGKQFLLNWSFYTSMIIRDLTLRSAMSFGSFTLIRLLADDYMYYLIESKIAKAGKQQLITVIRQEKDWPQDTQEYIVPSNDEDLELEKNGLL